MPHHVPGILVCQHPIAGTSDLHHVGSQHGCTGTACAGTAVLNSNPDAGTSSLRPWVRWSVAANDAWQTGSDLSTAARTSCEPCTDCGLPQFTGGMEALVSTATLFFSGSSSCSRASSTSSPLKVPSCTTAAHACLGSVGGACHTGWLTS